MLQLISRADDFGSCVSANAAILECVRAGVVSCVSVMTPGPSLDVAMLRQIAQRAAIGLHVTLNAEWEAVKWRPLSHPALVPSLLDENGYFAESPAVYAESGLDPDEAMAEVAAQLARLRASGIAPTYVDEHMAVSWASPELRVRLNELCAREELFDAFAVPFLPDLPTAPSQAATPPDTSAKTPDELAKSWLSRLDAAAPQTSVLVTHPCLDAPDVQALFNAHLPPGVAACERDLDRRALLSRTWRDGLISRGVKLVRYGE